MFGDSKDDPESKAADDIHGERAGCRVRGAPLVDGASEKIAGGRSEGAANGDVQQIQGGRWGLFLRRFFIDEIVVAPGARLRARNDAGDVRIFVA